MDLDVASVGKLEFRCLTKRVKGVLLLLLVTFTRSAETNGEKYQDQREVLEGTQS